MIRKILNELRHRKVLKTAFGYSVFAFATIEAIDIVTPLLGLPPDLLITAILIALAGFPVITLLSWNFDWTADGVAVGTPAPAPHSGGSHVISWVLVFLLGIAVAYLSYRLYGEASGKSPASGSVASAPALKYGKSVAVLPFVSIAAADEDDSYFSDGVAQEILTALAAVDGLRVAARSSSFAFRPGSIDVRSIGEQLQVSVVLEGSVRRAGEQLRVSAQLVNAETGFQMWNNQFDYARTDVFRVQEEIARSIVGALQLELGSEAGGPLIQPGTENITAYELYLKGRHLLKARRPDYSREAVRVFEEAIALDDNYAQAFAGLADAWISIREIGDLSMFEATQRSHDAITRALKLNAQLPEAQTSLGLCILGGGDKADALAQFDRAILLDPKYVDAHLWRANTLRDRGSLSVATRTYSQALALDPLNISILENQALMLAFQGRFEPALKQLQEIASDHPERVATLLVRGQIAMLAGDFQAAVDAADTAQQLLPGDAVVLAMRSVALTHLGRLAQARATLDRANELAPENEIVLLAGLQHSFLSGDYGGLDKVTAQRARLVLENPGFEGTDIFRERLVWSATAKLALGQAEQARDLLEQALAHPATPDFKEIIFISFI